MSAAEPHDADKTYLRWQLACVRLARIPPTVAPSIRTQIEHDVVSAIKAMRLADVAQALGHAALPATEAPPVERSPAYWRLR